ncbi:hypothetical protein [Aeromonas hydrophila]|uniref:hypothetical protein n=1 Tax=Aeromonas hydrophila TaxID=644 RepID=UPI002362D090|nr:hypothetical protein [Aeromonas hydrophila]
MKSLIRWWNEYGSPYLMTLVVGVACLAVYHAMFAGPISESRQSHPEVIPAGKVVDIKLHGLMFFSKSTVTTTTGIYQVNGAVSAIIGDASFLKTEAVSNKSKKNSLCIKSEVKTDCYSIL